jgi:DNA-binding protein H-NS
MKELEGMSLAQLRQVREEIDGLIERREQEERRALRQKLEGIAAEAGFSLADLLGNTAATPRGTKVKSAGGDKRSTVAPKYRDPATGTTWTGRGKKPKWVEAALASGKKLEDLAI